jgi:hypothetical protein
MLGGLITPHLGRPCLADPLARESTGVVPVPTPQIPYPTVPRLPRRSVRQGA